ENGKCLFREFRFQTKTTHHIDIKDHVFAFVPDAFYFGSQGSVEGSRIYLFEFYEFVLGYFMQEIFFGNKIVVDAIYFGTTRLTGACRDREGDLIAMFF